MAIQPQFAYTPSQGQVQTRVVNQNTRKSKAAEDIQSLFGALQAGVKAKVQSDVLDKEELEKKQKTALFAASDRLNALRRKTQDDQAKLSDSDVEGYQLLKDNFRTQADAIAEMSELSEAGRNSIKSSSMGFEDDLVRYSDGVIKRANKRAVEEGTTSLMMLTHNTPIANTKETLEGLKNDLINVGHTQTSAEEFMAGNYYNTKLSTIDIGSTSVRELDILISDTDEFLKNNVSSKLINKPMYLEFKDKVNNLQDKLKQDVKIEINKYVVNDATSYNEVKSMVTSALEGNEITKIEASNILEDKRDKVNTYRAKIQAKANAAEANKLKVAKRKLKALIGNPLVSTIDKNTAIQQAVELGIYLPEEAFAEASNIIVSDAKEAKSKADKVKTKQEKIQDEIDKKEKVINKTIINALKTKTSLAKEPTTPSQVQTLIYNASLGDGKAMTSADMKFISNYTSQWTIENTLEGVNGLFETTSNDYSNAPGQEGYVKGVNNTMDKFYTIDFNAKALLELNKRHHTKGNIGKLIDEGLNNQSTAMETVGKFKVMEQYDPSRTRALLGDDRYAILKRMTTVVTPTPDGKSVEIKPNDYREVKSIIDNPVPITKEASEAWNKLIQTAPELVHTKSVFDTYIKRNVSVSDAIDIIKSDYDKQLPVETQDTQWFGSSGVNTKLSKNISLKGYKHNLNDDDINLIKTIPDFLNTKNGRLIGIAYNRKDGFFYASSKDDSFYMKITDDNNKPFTKLEGTNGVINYLGNTMTKDIHDKKWFKDISGITSKFIGDNIVHKPTKEEIKSFTTTMKQ